jgi:hypothetical protein
MTTILSENNHTAPIYPKSRYITWEQFRGKYLSREDGYKYEWANGRVVKTRSSMGPRQIPIFVSLNRLLNRPEITSRYSGYLTAEIDLKLGADIHRRPDFAWFSDEQIHILATEKDAIQIPSLVIEVISPGKFRSSRWIHPGELPCVRAACSAMPHPRSRGLECWLQRLWAETKRATLIQSGPVVCLRNTCFRQRNFPRTRMCARRSGY